jgi:hypothetical protein
MADKKLYAWSTLYVGGESEMITSATGVSRKIIHNRNVIHPGEEVTEAQLTKLGATKEDWEAILAGGSVRDYPYPPIPEGSFQSPTDYVLETLRAGAEDIPQDTLVQLALQQNALHMIGGTTDQQVRELARSAQDELPGK